MMASSATRWGWLGYGRYQHLRMPARDERQTMSAAIQAAEESILLRRDAGLLHT